MSAVGNVFIDVLPSTQNFWKKVKSELGPGANNIGVQIGKEIGDPISEQVSDSITEPLMKAIPKAKKSGSKFGGAFADAAEKRIKAALSSLPDAEIGVSTSKADQDLKDLRARLASLADQRIGIDIDSATALSEVESIETELTRLSADSPDIDVRVNSAAAIAQLAAVKKMVSDIDNNEANVAVDSSGLRTASFAVSGLLIGALALGPALIPVVAAVGALGAALGAPLAAAGGGIGLYAIFTGVAITRLKETQKEIKKLRTQAASTADPKKAAQLSKAADDLESSLSKGERGYLKAEALLGRTFDAFIDKNTDAIFGPVNKGLELLADVLPKLSPLIKAVSGALTTLLGEVAEGVNSPGFTKFIDAFSGAAAKAIGQFGAIAKNVGVGLFNVFKGFGPLSDMVMNGLVNMTDQFAKWSSSAEAKNGISAFIDYVRQTGPKVISTIGSIIGAIVKIGIALAPFGGAALAGIKAVADTIRSMPVRVIQVLAGVLLTALVAMKAFNVATRLYNIQQAAKTSGTLANIVATKAHTAVTKAQTVAMRLLNAVMRMNPLGLLVTAITLVVGALVLLYNKNAAFRALVLAVWARIKSAIATAWGGIKGVFTSLRSWLGNVLPPIFARLRQVASVVFAAIRNAIKVWWNVVSGIFKAVRAVLTNVVFPIFRKLWSGIIQPVFTRIKSGASNLFSSLKGAFDRIKSAVGKLGGAFNAAKNSIGNAWDKIRAVVRKPIKWVVTAVVNKFIDGVNNLIPNGNPLKSISTKGWATGGYTGRGGKYEPAGIVHRDEYVINKASRRRIEKNHPGVLDAMNNHGELPLGYAKGGRVVPGSGRRHSGYPWATYAGDFPNPTGTPVRAWKDGVIALVRTLAGSYGKHIRMNHTDGTSSLYAHLSSFAKKTGDRVKQGTMIGRVGSTGNSTGPHLHFESMGGAYKGGPAAEPKVSAWDWLSKKFNFKSKLAGWLSGASANSGVFGDGLRSLASSVVTKAWSGLKEKIGGLKDTASKVGSSIFKKVRGFFDGGGLASGTGVMAKNTIAPERVLSPAQTQSFEKLASSNFLQSANKSKNKPASFELTITNWETGKGMIRNVADGSVLDREALSSVHNRMS